MHNCQFIAEVSNHHTMHLSDFQRTALFNLMISTTARSDVSERRRRPQKCPNPSRNGRQNGRQVALQIIMLPKSFPSVRLECTFQHDKQFKMQLKCIITVEVFLCEQNSLNLLKYPKQLQIDL